MIKTLYDKLSARKYREYTTCQFPGCTIPLKKLAGQRTRKYCSLEHAKAAQRLYIKEWKNRNRDKVKLWNQRYIRNRRKKIEEGRINPNK